MIYIHSWVLLIHIMKIEANKHVLITRVTSILSIKSKYSVSTRHQTSPDNSNQ